MTPTRVLTSLAELVTTPLLPAAYLDRVAPLRPGTRLRARVLAVHPETRDAVTLVLQPGRDWTGHVPGQYVRVGVDVDGVRQWRAYSLTSRPGERTIRITVKAITDGRVSTHLVRRTRPGDVLQLEQAAGEFTLPDPAPAKLLLVAGGSGITPVMGMLRSHPLDDVVLVHAALSRDDAVFGGELRALAARGALRLVEVFADTDGLLTAEALTALVPDLTERTAYACGPTGLMELVEQVAPDVRTERFRPLVVAPGEGGTVAFTRSDKVVATDGATTLLDAGEAAGVLMPSGCRMGICMACVLPLKEGAVRDLRNGELTVAVPGETDRDGVPIQTCISAAAGACRIDH